MWVRPEVRAGVIVAGNAFDLEQGELFETEEIVPVAESKIEPGDKSPEYYRNFYDEAYIVKQYKDIVERAKRDPKALKDAVSALDRLASLLKMDVGGNSARNESGTNINILSFDDVMRKKIVNAEVTTKEVDHADTREPNTITSGAGANTAADTATAEPADSSGGDGFGCRSATGDDGGKVWKPPF